MKTCRFEIPGWTLATCLFLALASPVHAAVFTVTSTADSGAGTLRDAIMQSNGVPGIDRIDFAIPGDEVQTIQLLSPLPQIFEGVLIDGYSQPGASPNTNPPGQGFNTVLKIEVKGSLGAPCFIYNATSQHVDGLGIQGLAINDCTDAILVTETADHVQVSGNFIGTDASGTVKVNPALTRGIHVTGASTVDINSNLVSGADNGFGIDLVDAAYVTVAGNLVGTNATGKATIPNEDGIQISCSAPTPPIITIGSGNVVSGNVIGISSNCAEVSIIGNVVGTDVSGTAPLGNYDGISLDRSATVTGNVISANVREGLLLNDMDYLVQGNFVGTDATATLDLGNGALGIAFASSTVIGGTGPAEGNVIAHNGYHPGTELRSGGIFESGSDVSIRGNRMFDNFPLGIDLFGPTPGVTLNDPGDVDYYIDNPLQNFPLITAVVPGGSTTHIVGSLNSMATQVYDIDLYASSACPRRPNDYLQGETYLGSLQVTTDGFGDASFAVDVPMVLAAGQPVTATATDAQGNTSEFSQRILFSVDPLAGPAGAAATLSGMEFEPGATVAVGGAPASNVHVLDPQTITATMPGFPAGTLHEITVAVPSGLVGTLPNGWLSDFTDVPTGHIFHDYVARLVVDGVAAGVGNGNYGVDQPTLREQMAVFLLKGDHGACYTPPHCTGRFGDVPCPSQYADWIEELAAEGITAGCGDGTIFCPGDPVLREEMAVFLLKAEHGSDYAPPHCSGKFTDVDCPSQYADWIEELAAENITGGCESDQYCPLGNTTRGQMAVFVDKTFSLP